MVFKESVTCILIIWEFYLQNYLICNKINRRICGRAVQKGGYQIWNQIPVRLHKIRTNLLNYELV